MRLWQVDCNIATRRAGDVTKTPEEPLTDDTVRQAELQLWAAAQTDFDPFEVPLEEWGPNIVPVSDVDDVRESLRRLDGSRLVLAEVAGDLVVARVIPDDVPL